MNRVDDPNVANPAVALERHVSALAAAATLARRELIRFARQLARIVAAVGTALILWLVVGGGLRGSVQLSEGASGDVASDYWAYLVPGVATLAVMFSAIFSNISAIEDRREGFLQAVLVAPAPRWSIALGIVGGGAFVAWLQGLLLVPLVAFSGATLTLGGVALAASMLATTAIALQSLGLCFAWRLRDAGSFHAVMNLVFMPLWLLSDAFLPVRGAAEPLATIIRLNPLSWCGRAVRDGLLGTIGPQTATSAAGAVAFAAGCTLAAILVVSRSRRVGMS